VVEFLDVVMHSAEIELLMEEVVINEKSPFVGATMEEVRKRCIAGANILALKKKGDRRLVPKPSPDTVVETGDGFVPLGTKEQLKELEGLTERRVRSTTRKTLQKTYKGDARTDCARDVPLFK